MGILELSFKPFLGSPVGSLVEPSEDLLDTLLPLRGALRLARLTVPVSVKRFNGPDEIHEAMFGVRQWILQRSHVKVIPRTVMLDLGLPLVQQCAEGVADRRKCGP